jgi:2-methylcitrate dehydratase PrpD
VTPGTRPITGTLAAYAANSTFASLPEVVRREGIRAFVNWMGCVLGGCQDPAVAIATAVAVESGASPQATLIGRNARADAASAAFVNCLSSAVNAFDDTHLGTVTHPTGPVAAALLAFAERQSVTGSEFITALVVGIEIQCRMSSVLFSPTSQASLGLYVTGLTAPIGAAAALGRLMGLDELRMVSAIGLAATKAAGIRATHGSMAGAVVPADAARSAVIAACLAEKGFTCTPGVLEAKRGFIDVYAPSANADLAVNGLGNHFETLANAYKPYPCGIVIHPAIDACLDLTTQLPHGGRPKSLSLRVHPLAIELADRRTPASVFEAQVSLYHWCAAALLRRSAGLAELSPDCIHDEHLARWRLLIQAAADDTLGRDEAVAELRLEDGRALTSHIRHARGSLARPMSDEELDAKFLVQARAVLASDRANELLRRCRDIAEVSDAGRCVIEGLQER